MYSHLRICIQNKHVNFWLFFYMATPVFGAFILVRLVVIDAPKGSGYVPKGSGQVVNNSQLLQKTVGLYLMC